MQKPCRDLRPSYDRLLRNLKAAQAVIASKSAPVRRCYGKEFTDRLFGLRKRAATGAHEFDRLCADLDIEHRLTLPMRPQPLGECAIHLPVRRINGMVERFNGRIEDVLQSHHFNSREELEQTLMRYVHFYNTQLPPSALKARTPVQEMKQWYSRKPELFSKRTYYLTGCDTYVIRSR